MYMSLSDLILPYQQLSTKNASRNKNDVAYRHQYAVVRYTNTSIFVAERLMMTERTLKCMENIYFMNYSFKWIERKRYRAGKRLKYYDHSIPIDFEHSSRASRVVRI